MTNNPYKNQSSAEKRLSELHMNDLPVMKFRIEKTTVPSDWFKTYKNLRQEFMQSLTDSIETLAFMNLTQEEFMSLITGQAMPKNTSLRFRVPLQWGGQLNLSNMFLCRTFPQSHNMDVFIIEQNKSESIWLPNPLKKIYIPSNTTGGGDGGNATADRISQMAARMGNENG